MWEILLPIFGLLVGIAASLVGIGGGAFIVPILTIIYALETPAATGTSLTAIIFTAIASTISYARKKRTYYKTGLILVVTTAPGAFLGSMIAKRLAPNLLGFIFGFFLILVAFRTVSDMNSLNRKNLGDQRNSEQLRTVSDDEILKSRRTIAVDTGLSFFGGLASGLLGIGGGVLIVPIMTLAMNMPIHAATATSMFTMIFTSMAGVPEYYVAGLVNPEFAALLALGSIFGAQVGVYASSRVSGKNLRRSFAVIVLVVSILMLNKYKSVLGF